MDTEKTPPPAVEPWHRSRMLLRNPVSLAGVALGIVSLANIFLFFLIDQIATQAQPLHRHSGLHGVAGISDSRSAADAGRRAAGAAEECCAARPFIRGSISTIATQRSAVISFTTFLVVFVVVSAAGSYKAYEFTESTAVLRTAMPHGDESRVHGVPAFSARARGLRGMPCGLGSDLVCEVEAFGQPAGVCRGLQHLSPARFPRPSTICVPAQETCEQCHWPKKFYGGQLKVFTHYANDEKNTLRQVRMLIKTGGGDPATGAPEGIHWHMNIGNKIEYVAADEKHQIIPYIHVEDLQGRVTEYYAKDSTLSKDQIAKADAASHGLRRLPQPSHAHLCSAGSVRRSVAAGAAARRFPALHQAGGGYRVDREPTPRPTTPCKALPSGLQGFYETKYPDVAKTKQLEIRNAVTEVQQIFKRTTFPEMKLNWQTHPNNLGHFYFQRMLPLP